MSLLCIRQELDFNSSKYSNTILWQFGAYQVNNFHSLHSVDSNTEKIVLNIIYRYYRCTRWKSIHQSIVLVLG